MHLHVICFDQPYPPAYGGAVEMYYKLRALHEAGHRLILHIFLYNNAERQEETERLAEKTYYYQRQTGIRPNLSLKPYIVNSRNDRQLLYNLCLDNYPILFEGLHTTFFLAHPRLAGRMKIVRTHNIEHTFYFYLAKNKPLAWQALFFMIESVKLKYYEKILRHADRILAISQADRDELAARYPDRNVRLLNCFFDCTLPETSESGNKPFDGKKYILYHANLAVSENNRAAMYIVKNIAAEMPGHHFVIAGRKPSEELAALCYKQTNVTLLADPQHQQLQDMIRHAHINLMLTFQPTGIKLKLLTTLAKSYGHCIANRYMLHGNSLGSLCRQADTQQEIVSAISQLMEQPADPAIAEYRQQELKAMGFGETANITEP